MKILSGLAEGQVLQRQGARHEARFTLTGATKQTGAITATISSAKGTLPGWKNRPVGKVARGHFQLKFSGVPAGGPYRLELRVDKNPPLVVVNEFYVGDVWLLAGQSNMQGIGNMSGAAKPHPLVRAFSMRREWRLATDALHVMEESPDLCHSGGVQCSVEDGEHIRQTALKGVGVGVFFGREMLKRSNVPQGLLCTAHGGTSMDQWDPKRKAGGPNSYYASMLDSWKKTGQPVSGVLWYQGESDADTVQAPLYTPRMKKLVAATRRDLRQPNLPWIIVQIARVIDGRELVLQRAWNSIQEQERLLPDVIKNLETVAAIDLALDDGIHVSAQEFPRLASRMARAADRLVYRNRAEQRPPQLKKVDFKRVDLLTSYIEAHFDNVVGGLHSDGMAAGFNLVNAEGINLHQTFKTTLHKNVARIHYNTAIAVQPLYVSYGNGVTPHCNVHDKRDFSLPVFGPIPLKVTTAFLPFVRTWQVSPIVTDAPSLGKLTLPKSRDFKFQKKTYLENGFINEREQWMGRNGQNYFFSEITLPEAMKLDVLMGYDGPFRIWLDGKPLFANLKGINPCIADESHAPVSLKAGKHQIAVAMDLNEGRAWGFFLRFARKDVTAKQIASGDFVKPVYLA